ncbi:uncharacterized protein B0H64DRAFT_396080 [Chaetomium fimeti]|uniref:Uncharacterized protein n=1 Tax=Chaetomium fimeti TaxID=1854472 RepID=A0AAE0LSJ6_9PEZI|nr:hypothetical protein B0H64DRAFT_396080 [Chaetomium fimeti]
MASGRALTVPYVYVTRTARGLVARLLLVSICVSNSCSGRTGTAPSVFSRALGDYDDPSVVCVVRRGSFGLIVWRSCRPCEPRNADRALLFTSYQGPVSSTIPHPRDDLLVSLFIFFIFFYQCQHYRSAARKNRWGLDIFSLPNDNGTTARRTGTSLAVAGDRESGRRTNPVCLKSKPSHPLPDFVVGMGWYGAPVLFSTSLPRGPISSELLFSRVRFAPLCYLCPRIALVVLMLFVSAVKSSL